MVPCHSIIPDWDYEARTFAIPDWDYEARTLDISMSGYIKKPLKFKHRNLNDVQSSPYRAQSNIYGKGAQDSIPADTTKKINNV